ncbi:MAG: PAS domain S-box protein [Bacteroidia bacterium]|nr:PAS domain S-box protein [Bacteroidia bacterium]
MDIAYLQILLLLLQCTIIAVLLLFLFRLRIIFGLSLLIITLGVFQFIQVFLTSTLSIEIYSGYQVSPGSMVLFTGSLFAILLVYLREDTLKARKIIYALFIANVIIGLLLVIFSFLINDVFINNVYNLPVEFYSQNTKIIFVGTVLLLLDGYAIVFLYEFLSKYIKRLFLKMLLTMVIVLSMDALFFALGVFTGTEKFQTILISGIASKSLAALVYSTIFTVYLIYIEKKSLEINDGHASFTDIFRDLTFREKYEDVLEKMRLKTEELKETQDIAQIGSYVLDFKTNSFESSTVFDSICGLTDKKLKTHEYYRNIIHPDDLELNDHYYLESIRTKKPYNRKYRIYRNDDHELKWISEQGRAIYNKGEPIQFKGTIQDITDQKFNEFALKKQNEELNNLSKELSVKNELLLESERKFKNLFAKSPISLWEEDFSIVKKLVDKKKTKTDNFEQYLNDNPDFVAECLANIIILNVNEVTLELLGVLNKEDLITHLSNNFNVKSYETLKKELIALAEGKKEFTGETQFTRSDGKIINALIKYVVINDDYSKAIISIVDITELSQAKERIEESEKQFRELFEKSGDAILIIKNEIFIECNQATIEMLEYHTKEEFLQTHPSKLSPIEQPDGKDSFMKAQEMMNISLEKGTHRFEWIHTKSTGEYFPVEVLLTAIVNEPENKIIHCVWRDITERKKAELTLLESEAALNNAQEIAQLGSFNLDLQTNIFSSSYIFDSIVGFKSSDIKTLETWRTVVHPEDLEDNKKMLKNCIKTKTKFNREYRIIHQNTKKVKWLHALGEIRYKDNTALNFIGTIQDITERKLNELAISLNEKKLIEIQKIANLGTYEIDLKTNAVMASSIYKSILGIKETPKNNKGWWKSITHPDDYENSELLWQECIANCKIYEDEYRIINDKKEIKWIYDLAEIKCENGIPSKVVGTIQDITVRKVAELTLKENELKLQETQKISRLGSFIFYDETNLFESNKIFDEIVGIDSTYKKNLEGWLALIYPEDFNVVKELLENSRSIRKEFRIIRFNDKEIVWVKGLAKINYDSNGLRQKVIGTLQDINDRKLSEIKIKRSDVILSQINSLVKVIDKNGNITYASPSFKYILGYEPEDMLGLGWWIKTTPDLDAALKLRDEVLNIVRNNSPLTDEIKNRWITTIDGKPKLFDWISSKGEEDSLIFVGIDVTEKQEKQQEFITLTETAHDAIILVDQDGEIFEWNKSSEEIFGFSKKEILGKKITSLMPKKYLSQYKEGYNKVMQEALKVNYRDRMVEGKTKDGRIFPMELSINFWKSNDKYVYCYFIRDITSRVREENIKRVLFNITKRSSDNIRLKDFFYYIKNELGKLINTNNFFIALYDDKTDMISTPYMVDELDDGTDFPKGETLTGHVIDTKKALLTSEKFVSYTAEGKKVIGLGPESKCWLGVPLLIDDIAIGAIVVQSYTDENAYSKNDVAILELVASNIAQLIQKTEDFERIQLLNQGLIQSSHGVIITNLEGEIEYTNPAFTELTGYTEEEALGKNPRMLKSGEHLEAFYTNLYDTILKGNTWYGELTNKHKDGHKYLIDANISSVKNMEGKITHYIMIFEDITTKRELERQFINAFIDAQEVEKQNFGEELHDGISQILSAESMYIDLLIEQNQDRINDKAKFLTKIKELNLSAVNETRNIAHGLMSSQLKQSGLLIAAENICIDYNLVKNIKFSFFKKDLNEEEISKEIKTNLFRIIQELTTNINRYSSATKASIEFRKIDHNKLKLTVKDNGIGMDYKKIKKERKVTGLQNVERRITFLKGTFEVESAPNKGTCWEITVPL